MISSSSSSSSSLVVSQTDGSCGNPTLPAFPSAVPCLNSHGAWQHGVFYGDMFNVYRESCSPLPSQPSPSLSSSSHYFLKACEQCGMNCTELTTQRGAYGTTWNVADPLKFEFAKTFVVKGDHDCQALNGYVFDITNVNIAGKVITGAQSDPLWPVVAGTCVCGSSFSYSSQSLLPICDPAANPPITSNCIPPEPIFRGDCDDGCWRLLLPHTADGYNRPGNPSASAYWQKIECCPSRIPDCLPSHHANDCRFYIQNINPCQPGYIEYDFSQHKYQENCCMSSSCAFPRQTSSSIILTLPAPSVNAVLTPGKYCCWQEFEVMEFWSAPKGSMIPYSPLTPSSSYVPPPQVQDVYACAYCLCGTGQSYPLTLSDARYAAGLASSLTCEEILIKDFSSDTLCWGQATRKTDLQGDPRLVCNCSATEHFSSSPFCEGKVDIETSSSGYALGIFANFAIPCGERSGDFLTNLASTPVDIFNGYLQTCAQRQDGSCGRWGRYFDAVGPHALGRYMYGYCFSTDHWNGGHVDFTLEPVPPAEWNNGLINPSASLRKGLFNLYNTLGYKPADLTMGLCESWKDQQHKDANGNVIAYTLRCPRGDDVCASKQAAILQFCDTGEVAYTTLNRSHLGILNPSQKLEIEQAHTTPMSAPLCCDPALGCDKQYGYWWNEWANYRYPALGTRVYRPILQNSSLALTEGFFYKQWVMTNKIHTVPSYDCETYGGGPTWTPNPSLSPPAFPTPPIPQTWGACVTCPDHSCFNAASQAVCDSYYGYFVLSEQCGNYITSSALAHGFLTCGLCCSSEACVESLTSNGCDAIGGEWAMTTDQSCDENVGVCGGNP